jgi:hypothetical protein
MPKDGEAREAFDSLVHIEVGNGQNTLFWRDRWIHGRAATDYAPGITLHVKTRIKNSRTVAEALLDNRWIGDINGNLATRGARECLALWVAIQGVRRDNEVPDTFSWPWAGGGTYTAKSTYDMLVQGSVRFQLADAIWKAKATPKSKLFMWLAVQHRIWTSDRRFRHGLQAHSTWCFVCLQEEDTAEHILIQCVVAREVLFRCGHALKINLRIPSMEDTIEAWWSAERLRCSTRERRWFDGLICTVGYALWKNRNAEAFQHRNRNRTPKQVADDIVEEFRLLKTAWRVDSSAGVGVQDRRE